MQRGEGLNIFFPLAGGSFVPLSQTQLGYFLLRSALAKVAASIDGCPKPPTLRARAQ